MDEVKIEMLHAAVTLQEFTCLVLPETARAQQLVEPARHSIATVMQSIMHQLADRPRGIGSRSNAA